MGANTTITRIYPLRGHITHRDPRGERAEGWRPYPLGG